MYLFKKLASIYIYTLSTLLSLHIPISTLPLLTIPIIRHLTPASRVDTISYPRSY